MKCQSFRCASVASGPPVNGQHLCMRCKLSVVVGGRNAGILQPPKAYQAKECATCREKFTPTSGNSRYCPSCGGGAEQRTSVGTTFTADDIDALHAVLAHGRRVGFAQTPPIVKLTHKAAHLKALLERGE